MTNDGALYHNEIHFANGLLPAAFCSVHDVNKSGWFLLIPIYNLILALTPGTVGPNEYGADPKSEGIGTLDDPKMA